MYACMRVCVHVAYIYVCMHACMCVRVHPNEEFMQAGNTTNACGACTRARSIKPVEGQQRVMVMQHVVRHAAPTYIRSVVSGKNIIMHLLRRMVMPSSIARAPCIVTYQQLYGACFALHTCMQARGMGALRSLAASNESG